MILIFHIIGTAIVISTLLPMSHRREWWIRACDFPRLQIAMAAALWLLLGLAFSAMAAEALGLLWFLAVSACLAYQFRWIYPNTEVHPLEILTATSAERDTAPRIRLLSSNVLTPNRNAAALLAHIETHKPDVIATLESDQWWQDQLDVLDEYPYRIACPLDNLYGMHLYSRLRLYKSSVQFLVQDDVPSIATLVQLSDGCQVQLHIVHPAPPAPGENETSTERDVELLVLAEALAGSEAHIIVAGDLNDVAWSATTRLFRQVSGLLDPRTGRGMYNTYHADHWFARWPLDHVFVSPHFRVIALERLSSIGSDHFPMLVDFAISEPQSLTSHPDSDAVDLDLHASISESEVAAEASEPVTPGMP